MTEKNPRGAGRKSFLGENPRLFTVPLRNEDRLLIDQAAAEQGLDATKWGRQAILDALERAGKPISGRY